MTTPPAQRWVIAYDCSTFAYARLLLRYSPVPVPYFPTMQEAMNHAARRPPYPGDRFVPKVLRMPPGIPGKRFSAETAAQS